MDEPWTTGHADGLRFECIGASLLQCYSSALLVTVYSLSIRGQKSVVQTPTSLENAPMQHAVAINQQTESRTQLECAAV